MDKFIASLPKLDKETFNPDEDFILYDKLIGNNWFTCRSTFNKVLEDNAENFEQSGPDFNWNAVNIESNEMVWTESLHGNHESISELYSAEEQKAYFFFDLKISDIYINAEKYVPWNANYVWLELVDPNLSLQVIDEHGWTSLHALISQYSSSAGTKFVKSKIYNFVLQNIQFPRLREVSLSDAEWPSKVPDSIHHHYMTTENYASFRCSGPDRNLIAMRIKAWA